MQNLLWRQGQETEPKLRKVFMFEIMSVVMESQ